MLKYPQVAFEIHKFQGLKKLKIKIQPLSGGLCASDISRTKPPMILMEPTWVWLGGGMNGGVVLGICVGNQKPDARRPSRPLPHKEQEGLEQRNAESKELVHLWQSPSRVDLSHVSWRELIRASQNYCTQRAARQKQQNWQKRGERWSNTEVVLTWSVFVVFLAFSCH